MEPKRANTSAPADQATCMDPFEEFICDSNDRVTPWAPPKNSARVEGLGNIFCSLPADVIVPLFISNKKAFNKSIRYLQKMNDYSEAAVVMKEMLLIRICCIAGVAVNRVTFNLTLNSKYRDNDHSVEFKYWFHKWYAQKAREVQERSRCRVYLQVLGYRDELELMINQTAAVKGQWQRQGTVSRSTALWECWVPEEGEWRNNVQRWHKHLRRYQT
jgi:hypothetical protein